ncbi:ribosome small subunit-dependent GTPase A [Francisella tularensis]|uniref:ribosome small subunit-dependent GTPase A n=1 Tax=Francisella tularensis TaxID=263 RepID=UPI000173E2D4|nr:ribosome small subunit-dependent GTPase A [Francisella tularensis]ACD31251.1 GTPase [Francisella tularensis subsp. mediasiatica FSC147]MBK2077956.1 ribosome small subunit-dependent GTPase A [Francisella tularensis subsp. mediasiatica]MBK2101847.1 ribosome small subunit-dependent GTPase A [Francisella tularensis subsp. mediasiatica]MBK2105334.1 ribosome small subunit-dependent GTPase A [Francisella tularensis subsp. mediasiatica]MDN9003726.1 ribosome small subunit-dependent GTPase A [Francis
MQAKVITNFGGNICVKLTTGEKVSALQRSHLKGELTVGDNVELEYTNATYVITKLLDRKNLISRPNQYQRKNKNIAANIDSAVIIITHSPAPIEHYIDRYLAALHNSDIEPIIVINKIDDQSKNDRQHLQCIIDIYKNIGYKIFYISAKNNIGIDSLLEELKDKTSIFIGQSGVGKSETLSTILGEKITATTEVSDSTKKGRHTTTCSTLYEINGSTNIIDSPGIREFGLWHISQEELFDGFLDFKKYKGMCQFRNCSHEEGSKGCEIVRQVSLGNINPVRFKNYHRILAEIKNN